MPRCISDLFDVHYLEPLANKVKDTGGVTFVPAFQGLFAPYWNAEARGYVCLSLCVFVTPCMQACKHPQMSPTHTRTHTHTHAHTHTHTHKNAVCVHMAIKGQILGWLCNNRMANESPNLVKMLSYHFKLLSPTYFHLFWKLTIICFFR